MGGFIGATEDGVTTTLGRGGSDFTASIVGAGIGAEEIQIWTDVDGMLTADPTIVAGGRRRQDHLVRRGRRAGLFRRQGAAPGHGAAGRREEHPGADPELAPAGGARARGSSPRRCPAPTPSSRSPASGTSRVVNIHSTRMLMAYGFLRRIFEVFDRYETAGGRGFDLGGQRLADHRQHRAPGRVSARNCGSSPRSTSRRTRRSSAWWATTSATRRASAGRVVHGAQRRSTCA